MWKRYSEEQRGNPNYPADEILQIVERFKPDKAEEFKRYVEQGRRAFKLSEGKLVKYLLRSQLMHVVPVCPDLFINYEGNKLRIFNSKFEIYGEIDIDFPIT